ncbi:MAG: DUF5615 family PIN-like protein [Armatimonadetes bacterium]|nr:DUF5615 family PIN-like protein [Armatimonadota bacterium]MDW8029819.1 DUF5615 family PIN-like protein [Armatimonadota bacterium]
MACKFVVDEDLPDAVAVTLVRMGYWAKHVRQVGLSGASDQEVFNYAQSCEAVLVTADKGFSDIRHFSIKRHYGIIVLRLKKRNRDSILRRLQEVISQLRRQGTNLVGRVVIISDTKFRIR